MEKKLQPTSFRIRVSKKKKVYVNFFSFYLSKSKNCILFITQKNKKLIKQLWKSDYKLMVQRKHQLPRKMIRNLKKTCGMLANKKMHSFFLLLFYFTPILV